MEDKQQYGVRMKARGRPAVVRRGLVAACISALALATAACGHRSDPPAASVAADPFTAPTPRPGKPLPPAPPATDGSIALRRMVDAYKRLGALQQTADADITLRFGAPVQVHQETVLKYQRSPARVALLVKDPVAGTQEFLGDGTSVVQYSAMANQFIRRESGPSLAAMVRRIDRDAPQIMSPLLFLTSSGLPDGVATARLVGPGTVDGKQAIAVDGVLSESWLERFASRVFASPVRSVSGSYTLWLDPATYLLMKSSVHMAWRGRTALHGQTARFADPRVDFTETVRTMAQNPTFAADAFRFVRPEGAKEVFVERRESEP